MAVFDVVHVPDDSNIFLDANVLIYGITRSSPSCFHLLERCSFEAVAGITSFAVIAEVTHKLMLREAAQKGLFANAQPCPNCKMVRDKGVQYLNEHPGKVKDLGDYWDYVKRILDLNLLFLADDEATTRKAQMERQSHGLLTNDSLIISLMREYGLSLLASNDRYFERVGGLSVFQVRDLPN